MLRHLRSSVQLDGPSLASLAGSCVGVQHSVEPKSLSSVLHLVRNNSVVAPPTQFFYRLKSLYTLERHERVNDNHVSFEISQ